MSNWIKESMRTYSVCGIVIRFAGGITSPESRTRGIGAPSHWEARVCNCRAESWRSLGDNCDHITWSKNVMCLVATAEWPTRLAATTRSWRTNFCNPGHPSNRPKREQKK